MSKESRQKMSVVCSGERHYNWKGGISRYPYCWKFSPEFKERCRAWYGYQCIECGTPQHALKIKLHVHHVNDNKQSCCDNSIPIFAVLCKSCHAKVQYNRKWWEQYFTNIINNYYQGKCYFTKEEMKIWNQY